MVDPVQGASNSTGFFSFSNLTAQASKYGSSAISGLLGVGKFVCNTIGYIPGVGTGVIAVGGGLYVAVNQGRKAVKQYRDIEICDGDWKGVLRHGLAATFGIGVAVVGAATIVVFMQSPTTTTGAGTNLANNATLLSTTGTNDTVAANVSALNDTLTKLAAKVETIVAKNITAKPWSLDDTIKAIAKLSEKLHFVPEHIDVNGSCYYLRPNLP
jgi:hypothetical protein